MPDWVKTQDVTESVEEMYQLIDIFLSPSRQEAFGYAVVESYYSGCEVVASDVPGQNSLKEINGIEWCASFDAESLAKAVATVIEKLRYGKVVSIEERRRYLEQNYCIDNWVNSVLKVYKGVMEPLS